MIFCFNICQPIIYHKIFYFINLNANFTISDHINRNSLVKIFIPSYQLCSNIMVPTMTFFIVKYWKILKKQIIKSVSCIPYGLLYYGYYDILAIYVSSLIQLTILCSMSLLNAICKELLFVSNEWSGSLMREKINLEKFYISVNTYRPSSYIYKKCVFYILPSAHPHSPLFFARVYKCCIFYLFILFQFQQCISVLLYIGKDFCLWSW